VVRIRNGFVSNSSSSSFIIFVDKKPRTIKETQKLFLGDDAIYPDPYYDPTSAYFKDIPAGYPAEEVAADIFEDLKDQKPMTIEELAEELGSGYLPDDAPPLWYSSDVKHVKKVFGMVEPQYEDFKKEDGEYDWQASQKASEDFQKKVAEKLIKEFPNKEIYRLNYADDTSYGSALEHGTLFDRVEHYRISQH